MDISKNKCNLLRPLPDSIDPSEANVLTCALASAENYRDEFYSKHGTYPDAVQVELSITQARRTINALINLELAGRCFLVYSIRRAEKTIADMVRAAKAVWN